MYAYCNNNPVFFVDFYGTRPMPFYELSWPGEIHNEVQEYIVEEFDYQKEVKLRGVGRIDLVNGNNAYEIKPYTYNTPKLRKRASKQLQRYIKKSGGKYVTGQWAPELNGSFVSQRGYNVSFYYVGDGLIFYSFYRPGTHADVPVVLPYKERSEGNSQSRKIKNSPVGGLATAGVIMTIVVASYQKMHTMSLK